MIQPESVIAVIPARGGSERIPGKNLLPLLGKPLIAHSIEHAKAASLVGRVIVSTDNEKIAETSRQYGADVIMRPPELATSTASSEVALIHVLDTLEREGQRPEVMVFLQCTSPLRDPGEIDNAIRLFDTSGADSVFSGFRWNKFIWRMDGPSAVPLNYDYRRRMREQDFPVQYQENGSIYVFKTSLLRQTGNRLGGKIAIYEMPYLNSFQIDAPEDIELIEWAVATKAKHGAGR